MRDPRGILSALRRTALACSSLLASACGGSAGDRSVIETPSEGGPGAGEPGSVGAEQDPVEAATTGGGLPSPRPEPVDTSAPPPLRSVCDPGNGLDTYTYFQSQADLEALAGCEVLRGFIQINVAEGMDLTPLASLRAVEGSLHIGSNVLDPDPSSAPVRLRSLRGLERLESARELSIQHAEGGLGPLGRLREVEALYLGDLPGVIDLEGLASVRVTRALSLEAMPDLVSLEGFVAPPALDELSVWHMPRLASLDGLDGLESLRNLTIYGGAAALTELGLPASLVQLAFVQIHEAPLLASLAELSRVSSIEDLRVSGSPLVADLGGGGVASGSLQRLHVHDAPLLARIDPAGGLAGLLELELINCDGITELDALSASPLEYIGILDSDGLTRLPTFDQAGSTMRRILLWNNTALVEGPSFPNLTTLYLSDGIYYESAELDIQGNPALRSIGSFPRLASASMVTISNNPSLEAVSLPSLERLIALRLYDDASLRTLELGIERDLRSVELDTIPLLGDVTLGTPTSSLRRLTLRNTPSIDPDVRQQLLDLVNDQTQLTLD